MAAKPDLTWTSLAAERDLGQGEAICSLCLSVFVWIPMHGIEEILMFDYRELSQYWVGVQQKAFIKIKKKMEFWSTNGLKGFGSRFQTCIIRVAKGYAEKINQERGQKQMGNTM